MSRVTKWLRPNRFSLNVAKTEIIIFRSEKTIMTEKMNFRLSGRKIKTKKQTKYLGIVIDEHLSFKTHIKSFKQNIIRATDLLV